MTLKTPINRKLQKMILEHVAKSFPISPTPTLTKEIKEEFTDTEIIANLQNLSDHGLIDLNMRVDPYWVEGVPWNLTSVSATSPGAELIEYDGGLNALIKTIESSILDSDENTEIKNHLLSLLKSLSTESKTQLISKWVSWSIQKSPGAFEQVKKYLAKDLGN